MLSCEILLLERNYVWLVIGYVVLYVCLACVFQISFDWPFFLDFTYDLQFLGVIVFSLYCILPFRAFIRWKNKQDIELCGDGWRQEIRQNYLNLQKFYDFVIVLISIKIVLLIHTIIKQVIPLINSSCYDQEIAKIDTVIHFGKDPAGLLKWIGHESTTIRVVDYVYFSWYYVKGVMLTIFTLVPNRKLHKSFFTSLFAVWIFGGLLALAFPSVGPVYVNPDFYHNMNAPIAQGIQSKLWFHYTELKKNLQKPSIYLYEGVAAIPSLHVAVVALYGFEMLSLSRFAAGLLFIYLLAIQVSSVILGWHYAVDGYLGILIAWICHSVTRKILNYKGEQQV